MCCHPFHFLLFLYFMSTVCEKGHTGAQDLIWSSMQDPLKPPLIHYLPSSEVEYPRTDWDLILIDNICKQKTLAD